VSWREQLRRGASFRGVPFLVDASEMSGGRRGPVHEYPGKDVPYREDLGREKRSFTLSGFVVGDNYFADRDRLREALEARGPGPLLHPYHGTRQVAVLSFRIREGSQDGGLAHFEMEFLEVAESSQLVVEVDAVGVLASDVATALQVAQEDFLANYDPGIYSAGPAGVLAGTVAAVDEALRGLTLGTQELAEVRRRLTRLADEAAALLAAPAELEAELAALLFLLPGELLAVFGLVPGVRPLGGTANRDQERRNYDVLYALVQRLAVVRAVELVAAAKYESYEAAVTARDGVLAPLDLLLGGAGDAVYGALDELRASVVLTVPGEASDLPHLVEVTLAVSSPSLVLTHRLDGDIDEELALVARNGVKRPGFLPAGRALEVLSGG